MPMSPEAKNFTREFNKIRARRHFLVGRYVAKQVQCVCLMFCQKNLIMQRPDRLLSLNERQK